MGSLRAGALPALLLLAGLTAPNAVAPPPRAFSLRKPPACPIRISYGDRDIYEIVLPADRYLHAAFDQQGADVAVVVFPPGGQALPKIDSPNGVQGSEEVHLVSTEAGRYRFEVSTSTPGGGNYCVRFLALCPPSPKDRAQAAADRNLFAGRALDRQSAAQRAEARYRRALPLFAAAGDRWHQAVTLYYLAELLGAGHAAEAENLLQQAESIFSAVPDRGLAIESLLKIGGYRKDLSDFPHAIESYQRAYDLAAAAPKLTAKGATALHELGFLFQTEGQSWRALHAFRRAVELWHQLPAAEYREKEANSLTGLGWVYAETGDWDHAKEAHVRALELRQRSASADRRAVSAIQIGGVLLHTAPSLALAYVRKARQLQTEAHSKPHDRAATLNLLGKVLVGQAGAEDRRRNDLEARDLFRQAFDLYSTDPPDRSSLALTASHLGWIELDLGEPAAARQRFGEALKLARRAKNPQVEAWALVGLAEAALELHDLPVARRHAEEALDHVEGLRADAVRTDLQASYLADNVNVYNLLVRILMEQHRREPGKAHDIEAFERNEQTRARSLLDALQESTDRQAGPTDKLLAERRTVRGEIAALVRQSDRPDGTADDAATLERRLSDRLDQLYELNAEIDRSRGRAPRADLNFSWHEARSLLDKNTLFLEYSFGKQSYLWVVTDSGVQSFQLAGNDELEPLLRAAAETLKTQAGADHQTLLRLSRLLLGPVADQLRGKRRLLIASDGGAQYLPFAVLPDPGRPPGSPSQPLLVEHEIDYVPSLTVLGELRNRREARQRASFPLAVVADPVFDRYDHRIEPSASPTTTDDPETLLLRLRETRTEAEAITRLLPGEKPFTALDFDATRDLVTGGSLGGYRILHFATHGILDTVHPELSALVFSRWDKQGQPRDGYLRVSDLQDVALKADLVVLSACKTALGRETPGEGLVGLPQAFLTAGASSVLVSLWQVEDHSTAVLMSAFYRHLLNDRLPAGQALRQAQLEVRAIPRWRAPRHWAGFVLQGDAR